MTDRYGGGILLPDGQNVMQFLQNKYLPQMSPNENTFLLCENLPIMIDVDVTSEHIDKLVRSLHGSGTDADH